VLSSTDREGNLALIYSQKVTVDHPEEVTVVTFFDKIGNIQWEKKFQKGYLNPA